MIFDLLLLSVREWEEAFVAREWNDDPSKYSEPPEPLASCSLVSRAWRRATEPFLFRTIFLKCYWSNARSFQDLLHFLEARPDLGEHCKCLEIHTVKDFDIDTFLYRVLPRLPSLRQLGLHAVPIAPSNRTIHTNPGTTMELMSLHVSKLYSPDPADRDRFKRLRKFLRALPLSCVGLAKIKPTRFRGTSDALASPSTDFPELANKISIGRLMLHGEEYDSHDTAIKLFVGIASPGSLRSLDMNCPTRQDVDTLVAFLRTAGANLTELEIDLTTFMELEQRASISDEPYVGHWSAFNDAISACPNLETLHIHLLPYAIDAFLKGRADFELQRYPLFANIARALPPGLRTFKLSLHTLWDSPSWCHCIELWDLHAMDVLADEQAFARFESVVAYMPEWPELGVITAMDTAERGIKEDLPRLYRAKKIQYDWEEAKREFSSDIARMIEALGLDEE